MNKILVTGAAGYIGGTFAYEVLKKGFIVHGIDSFINSNRNIIDIFSKDFRRNDSRFLHWTTKQTGKF